MRRSPPRSTVEKARSCMTSPRGACAVEEMRSTAMGGERDSSRFHLPSVSGLRWKGVRGVCVCWLWLRLKRARSRGQSRRNRTDETTLGKHTPDAEEGHKVLPFFYRHAFHLSSWRSPFLCLVAVHACYWRCCYRSMVYPIWLSEHQALKTCAKGALRVWGIFTRVGSRGRMFGMCVCVRCPCVSTYACVRCVPAA
jgi:hypothetical protein